jgi:hypothetical protein
MASVQTNGIVMRKLLGRVLRRAKEPLASLEIHVVGSPTILFFNMVRCLVHSLRRFGGTYRDSPVIFTVADKQEDPSLADRLPWLKSNGVELRWAPAERFLTQSYIATGYQVAKYRFQSRIVLALDADTLIAGPLDELVNGVARDHVFAGMIAHADPFANDPALSWEGLFRHCGLDSPALEHEYTGWGYMNDAPQHRYCPTYFNCGVLCCPADYLHTIGHIIEPLAAKAHEYLGNPFFANQAALAMALAQLKLPTRQLPMRYNFANDPLLEALHADEVPQTRIIHLLRRHQGIYKHELFADLANVEAMLRREDLRVINRRAQEVLRAIWPALRDEEATLRAA